MTHFVFPILARRAVIRIVLTAILLSSAAAFAQGTDSQFNDLAARAAAARDQQNVPLAIQLYAQAEQLKPDWQEGWWYLGVLQYGSDQFPGAIEAFTNLLELVPTAVPAMALRGLCEFETGAYDDSLRDLEQAVAHGALNEPRNEQIIRFHLAQLLAHASRFQEALEQYRYLATEKAEAPDLLIGIGLAGMHNPALPKELSPSDRALYEPIGSAGRVFFAGDSDRADELFSQLFNRFPAVANLHFFYGFLLFPHDPALAIDQFRSELAVNPDHETATAMLALTLVIAGRFNDALEPAKRAYEHAPNLEIAQVALGRSLAETGDMKRGGELLNAVIAHNPNSLEAHLGLASIYSRSGNRQAAEREREVCRALAK